MHLVFVAAFKYIVQLGIDMRRNSLFCNRLIQISHKCFSSNNKNDVRWVPLPKTLVLAFTSTVIPDTWGRDTLKTLAEWIGANKGFNSQAVGHTVLLTITKRLANVPPPKGKENSYLCDPISSNHLISVY